MLVTCCPSPRDPIMTDFLVFFFAIALGFVVLSWSAARLVNVASTLAAHFGLSILVIGMTIVAFGTSAPELVVSAVAGYEGAGGIAIGNALGSNIINTGLVLALCGLVRPLLVSRRVLARELPLLLAVMLLAMLLMIDGELSRVDSAVLGTGLIGYCLWLARGASDTQHSDSEVVVLPISNLRALAESVVMLGLLMGSSRLLVWGASGLAEGIGISEQVIGLTVVALGTSLPELAAALASVRKGLFDMVMATVLGSNIFNLLGVLAFPGLLGEGILLDSMTLYRDCLAMLGLTLLVLVNAMTSGVPGATLVTAGGFTLDGPKARIIPRYKSAILLFAFVVYGAVLLQTAS